MQIPVLQLENQKVFVCLLFGPPSYLFSPSQDFTMGVLNWISLNVFQGVDVWLVEDDKEIKQQLLK